MLNRKRTIKRLGYRLKRALHPQKKVTETRKVATLADIRSKLEGYEKTQGPADFTGPRVANGDD